MNYAQIKNILSKNVVDVIEKDSLEKKLKSSRKLRIKIGLDPTKPDLHLGHAVVLGKLKEFQQLGHTVIFLVGDFTAKIGDPSGRDNSRPILSDKEIEENSKTYLKQVGKILEVKKCEIKRNSEWFSKMSFAEVLKFISRVTVAQVIEREDFKNRLKKGLDLGIHEIIYPMMQGYDSVQLRADVELGGTDQYLNLLMGRILQKKFNQPVQDILTVPLLVGTDGIKKMSKSYDNYIGLNESPEMQFGKVMSIPDHLIESYLDLATDLSKDEIKKIKQALEKGQNPKEVKELIAENVVKNYHSIEKAREAKKNFESVFRQGNLPQKIREIKLKADETGLVEALVESGLASSKSVARRLISQGGVKVDGKVEQNYNRRIRLLKPVVISVGKLNFVRLRSGTKEKD